MYAAAPGLIDQDVILMLNDDDWFAPDHVESLVGLIERENLVWAYSHRKIHDADGAYLFDDVCESLGEAHDVWNIPGHRFVETCSIAMRTPAYVQCAQVFNWPSPVNDRVFYDTARRLFPRFGGTNRATINFRLGGNPGSVTREYFEAGNAAMLARYPKGLPWRAGICQIEPDREIVV